jgi:hypothetical protein
MAETLLLLLMSPKCKMRRSTRPRQILALVGIQVDIQATEKKSEIARASEGDGGRVYIASHLLLPYVTVVTSPTACLCTFPQ